jgi:exoribonuclease-2
VGVLCLAIDRHAWTNTTTVYTSARMFPMLPERLRTDLTSLNPGQDRLALVTERVVAAEATIQQSTVYRALVRNQAKLAYDAVSAAMPVRHRTGLPQEARAHQARVPPARCDDAAGQAGQSA